MSKEELKSYKQCEYEERKTFLGVKQRFEAIKQKYRYRDSKVKAGRDEAKKEAMKNKNHEDHFKDLYTFFKTNQESKNILSSEHADLRSKFKDLEDAEKRGKIECKKGDKKAEVEECSCDYDIDCKYCNNLIDEDKNLNALAEHTWTQEEERQFEEKEMNEYRENKRIERNKKRKEKSEDLRKPAPPLPERELCLYEKIRGDIIEKREKEWKIYEKEWEKKEKGNK